MFDELRPKLLIVDDSPAMRDFLKLTLEPMAARLALAVSAHQALEFIEGGAYDLVICDIRIPGPSGLELLSMAYHAKWDVGFILITGHLVAQSVVEALRLGAFDYLLKPFTANQLTAAVERAYRRLLAQREADAYRKSLEESITHRTRGLQMALQELERNYQTTLEALVAALDAREHETYAHSFRVRAYTTHLARLAGYPPAMLPDLERAALLHDIGKIAVADAILRKPGKLTPEEWVEMRKHSAAGEVILMRIPFLVRAAEIVRHHHERYDGEGYPDKLQGESILLGARLFAVADTLDAMTADRPYRKARGFPAAREEIQLMCGTQFDPRVVELFLRVPIETWQQICAKVNAQRASSAPSPPEG